MSSFCSAQLTFQDSANQLLVVVGVVVVVVVFCFFTAFSPPIFGEVGVRLLVKMEHEPCTCESVVSGKYYQVLEEG